MITMNLLKCMKKKRNCSNTSDRIKEGANKITAEGTIERVYYNKEENCRLFCHESIPHACPWPGRHVLYCVPLVVPEYRMYVLYL